MKKLMVMVVVMCAAVAAQATSKLNFYANAGDGDEVGRSKEMSCYYLPNGGVEQLMGTKPVNQYGNLDYVFDVSAAVTAAGNYNFYFIKYDKDNYYAVSSPVSVNFKTSWGTNYMGDLYSVSFGAWTIPEPTSGLLMLLGLAGLALKRKRA